MRALTVKERIQLHLFDYSRFAEEYESPSEVTQEGIALAVGIRVHHVNQYAGPLGKEGLIEVRMGHVKRARRRRRVYFLTPKGRIQAADLRAHLFREEIPFRDRTGQTHQVPLARIVQEDRRGSSVLSLLAELRSQGYVGEITTPSKPGFVDMAQEAPSVDRFYGRESELASVLRALEGGRIVVATGITGIGKSALGAKVCEALRDHRSLFWRTIRPWDTTTDLAGRLGGFLRSQGRLELGGLLLGAGPKDPARIEDALAADLRSLPALLVFDDVQNASTEAQSFLRIVIGSIPREGGPAVLFLSRVVPDFYSRKDVALDASVVEVTLNGLDRASSVRLLADAGVRDPIAGSLTDACGGIPLFLKLIVSAGPKAASTAGWATLETYIAEQIEPSLDAAERSALEAASLYDIPVPSDALLLEEEVRGRTLVSLRRKGLLTPAGDDRSTVHEAIRTIVQDGLPPTRREGLVRKIVPWLLQASLTAVERGDVQAAISYLANAVSIEMDPSRRRRNRELLGDLRRRLGDVPGAMDVYRIVLKEVSDGPERAILRQKIASCLELMGHLKEASEEIDAGWREIPPGPSLAAGWLAYQTASIAFSQGDYDAALREVERVLGWMSGLPPESNLWGWLANLRGLIYLYDPRREDLALAREDFLAAAQALEQAKEPHGVCMAYNNVFIAAAALGDQQAALPFLDRSAALARASGDVPALETALFTKAWSLTEHVGDFPAAEALYNETYRLAKETHQREKVVWHFYHFAILYLRMGRHAEARESMAYFLQTSEPYVNQERRVSDLAEMARVCLAGGDESAAEAYLRSAEELARHLTSDVATYPVQWARATLRGQHGDVPGAKEDFEKALGSCPAERRGELLLDYGRFLASAPEPGEAKQVLERADALLARYQGALQPLARAALQTLGASS